MILTFHAEDSPLRPGYKPQGGDAVWTLFLPLSNGDDLRVTMGHKIHKLMIAVLSEESIDDSIEEALTNGQSENNNQTPA